METVAIRGAITVEHNTKEDIVNSAKELVSAVINEKQLTTEDIIEILFTSTKDLTAAYPAIGARELGITHAALMCMQEMYVEGSLPKCIRVAMLVKTNNFTQYTAKHQYLKEAAKLRPDLINNTEAK